MAAAPLVTTGAAAATKRSTIRNGAAAPNSARAEPTFTGAITLLINANGTMSASGAVQMKAEAIQSAANPRPADRPSSIAPAYRSSSDSRTGGRQDGFGVYKKFRGAPIHEACLTSPPVITAENPARPLRKPLKLNVPWCAGTSSNPTTWIIEYAN